MNLNEFNGLRFHMKSILTFPFGPSTSVLPFGQAQAELRDLKIISVFSVLSV